MLSAPSLKPPPSAARGIAVMSWTLKSLTALCALSVVFAMPAFAGGDKNAYNNPNGEPSSGDFEAPYVNQGDGRVMVFCAEDEKLVVTPIDSGAVEAVCVPDGD